MVLKLLKLMPLVAKERCFLYYLIVVFCLELAELATKLKPENAFWFHMLYLNQSFSKFFKNYF